MALLTVEEITNLYLYGDISVPGDLASDSIRRDDSAPSPTVYVDRAEFMSGPGRFASAYFFEILHKFFDLTIPLHPGTYREVEDLRPILGGDAVHYQKAWEYDDGKNDYAERVYIWNSMAFEIHDDARFIVKEDGARHIENFAIVPVGAENFDFEGGGILAALGNIVLERAVDPHGIGKKVNIQFAGNIPFKTYELSDFIADQNPIKPTFFPRSTIDDEIFQLLDNLFEDGSTRFLDEDKPLIYGSNKNDSLEGTITFTGSATYTGMNILNHRSLSAYWENGFSYFGGDGDDKITGTKFNDILDGGLDDDFLLGEDGDDVLNGGSGNDTLNGGTGSDKLEGGADNDTYIFDGDFGQDLVEDTHGDGSIVINGVTLSDFTPFVVPGFISYFRHIDSSKTVSAIRYLPLNGVDNGTYTIALIPILDNTPRFDYSNTVIIKDWSAGDLGISFSPLKLPTATPRPPAKPPALPPAPPIDPLALDLNGDGKIGTLPITSGVHFDLDNSGFAERTSWVAPEDGLLVLDRNNNNFIDGGAELFGTETLLQDGQYAANGFEALKDFDTNRDGKIDNNDAVFSNLKVWKDQNSNGLAEASELKGLADLAINSIGITYTHSVTRDTNNVEHREAGVFTYNNSAQAITNTLWFESDRRITKPVIELQGNITIPEEIKKLPNVTGFGNNYSLHHAMAIDSSGALQGKVEAFVAENNPEKRRQLLRDIMILWTGKTVVQPGSRGSQVDATSLLILESFWGQSALQYKPIGVYARSVNDAYMKLEESLYSQLMSDSHMKDILSLVSFTENDGHWAADYSVAVDYFASGFIANGDFVAEDMKEFFATIRGMDPYSDSLYQPLVDLVETNAEFLPAQARAEMLGVIHEHDENIKGSPMADLLEGFGGNDSIYGGLGNDSIYGGSDNDKLYGEVGDDELNGGNGVDWLYGGNGNDTLSGGVGSDKLFGGEGDDTYKILLAASAAESGNIIEIEDVSGNDKIIFNSTIKRADLVLVQLSQFGELTLRFSGDTNGSVVVKSFSDSFGSLSIESFIFENGDVLTLDEIKLAAVKATDRDDVIYGFAFGDTITGGKGNDRLYGYGGDDVYIYNKGDGRDKIIESSGNDKILLGVGIIPEDVFVESFGTSIYLTMAGRDSISIVNMLNPDGNLNHSQAIESVVFANGDVWTSEQILNMAKDSTGKKLIGSTDNETLIGTQKNDELRGNEGFDYLYGELGNDSYVYELGGRRDYIVDSGGNDRVVFGDGITPEQLKVRRVETDIRIDIDANTGITLTGLVTSAGKIKSDLIVETFEFANGTVWSANDLFALATTGTNLSDELHGFTHADTYEGKQGDDLFIDHGGDDRYIFSRGDGSDAIQDAGGNDEIVFGSSVSVSDVIVRQVNDGSLVLSYGNDDVRVQSIFDADGIENPDISIETVRFSNEETWSKQELLARALLATVQDDTIIGFATDDTLTAYGGFDVLNGKSGDDVYHMTAGQFIGAKIQDSAGSNDVIQLAGNFTKEGLTAQIDGNDLIVSMYSGESIHIVGGAVLGSSIESMVFANNDILSQEQLISGASFITKNDTNVVSRGSNNDQIFGVSWNDSLSGGDGSDSLYGGSGHDTLHGGVGANYLYGGNGNDVINGESGDDVLYGHLGDDLLNGGDGNDLIFGGRGEDTLIGGLGDDYLEFGRSLSGGDGNDILFVKADNRAATLDGGTGNDTFKIGTSAVRTSNQYNVPFIRDSSGVDKIQLMDEWDPATISVMLDVWKNYVVFFRVDESGNKNALFSYDTIKLANNEIDVSRVESVEFASGEVWDTNDIRQKLLKGSIGKDTLQGYSSNDTLEGGKGNDELQGDSGDDVYLYSRGDGHDVIKESTGIDTIRFTDIDENAQIRISRGIHDLNIIIDENSSISVRNIVYAFDGNGPISEFGTIDYIEFADGKRWDLSRIYAETLRSTDENDTIHGFNSNDYIDGGLGNDYLIGNGGYDTLIGGKGNDFLSSSLAGKTEYYFSLGDGIDTVRANAASDEIIQFGEGVNPSDLVIERTVNGHLSIAYSPTDKILLEYAFSNPDSNKPKLNNLVEKLTFLNAPDVDFLQHLATLGFDVSRPVINSVNIDPTGSRVTGIATPGTEIYLDLNSDGSQWRAFADSTTGIFVIELGLAYINAQAFTIKTFDSGYNASPSISIKSPDLIPPIKPTATLSTNGNVISGSGEVGSIVVVKELTTNAEIASITIQNTNGQYSINLPLPLLNGEKISVFAKDLSNNASASVALTAKDITAPNIPTASFDATGKIITGIAEAGSTVIVKNTGGTQLKTAVADASGAYSITLTTALINKETVNVTAKDAAGNISAIKAIIAPDKTAPIAPTANVDGAANTVTGVAEAGSTVVVKSTSGDVLGSVQANATNGQFTIVATRTLVNGESLFTTATDTAGNISTATTTQVVITQQPSFTSGLRGSFYGYHQPSNGNVNLTNVAQVLNYIATKTADATFTATRFQYGAVAGANDLGMNDTLQKFLKSDAASLSADPASTSDAIIRFDGKIQLNAGTYNFRVSADDGYSIRINGAVVAQYNANGGAITRTHAVFNLTQSGLHDIEIIYWDAAGGNALNVELKNAAVGTYHYLDSSILFTGTPSAPAVDTTPPVIPTATFDAMGTVVSGIAESGSVVEVKNAAGSVLGSATANATTGAYSVSLATPLINVQSVNVTAKDAAGNVSAIRTIIAPDKTAPVAPTATVDGSANTVTGVAEAGSTVVVKSAAGDVLGTVQAHATTGQFAITAIRTLVNGESIFTTAIDAAGNISAATSLQVVIAQQPSLTSGLRGSFYGYHQPSNGNVELTNIAQVLGLIANKTPDATFTATNLQYAATKALGMDANLQTFLKGDAASLSADPTSTSDAIIRFDGKIQLSAGSYNFRVRADDGYSIRVNGAVVAEHNANQSPTTRTHGAFTIGQSGLHNIEIIYWDAGVGNALAVELANTATGTYNYLTDSILFQPLVVQPVGLHNKIMAVPEDAAALFYVDKNAALIQAMASFAPESGVDTRYRATHLDQGALMLAVGS